MGGARDLLVALKRNEEPVVVFGRTAYSRIGLFLGRKNFSIFAHQNTADLELIRDSMKVVTATELLRDVDTTLYSAKSFLASDDFQKWVRSGGDDPYIYINKMTSETEKLVDDLELRLMMNRSDVGRLFEDKWEFRRLAVEAGVEVIEGKQMQIDEMDRKTYEDIVGSLGKKLVFQLADYVTRSGGVGTFFIDSWADVEKFLSHVNGKRRNGEDLTKLNVTRYIEGESASILGCTTRWGVVVGDMQRQLIDIKQSVDFEGRSGVFCGHEWSGDLYGEDLRKQAKKIVKKLGKYMYSRGYKGMFGLDLVVDKRDAKVYLVECNSRYTSALPMYSMLQGVYGEVPIDAYHLGEFLIGEECGEVSTSSQSVEKTGAQLLISNLSTNERKVGAEVRAGVYRFGRGGLEYKKASLDLGDISSDNEFILTDGIPQKGWVMGPKKRVGRLLFRRKLMDGDVLSHDILELLENVYSMYKFE